MIAIPQAAGTIAHQTGTKSHHVDISDGYVSVPRAKPDHHGLFIASCFALSYQAVSAWLFVPLLLNPIDPTPFVIALVAVGLIWLTLAEK